MNQKKKIKQGKKRKAKDKRPKKIQGPENEPKIRTL